MRSQGQLHPGLALATGQVMSMIRLRDRRVLGVADAGEVGVGEDRVLEDELAGVLGRLGEEVAGGADAALAGS